MGLGIGIVGLPNVGKSTLFNAITRAGALAANFPFATIDKNVGVVALPDERLEALSKVFTKGERVPPIIPTSVEFVDIAGLVKGASSGEGLGNQFLSKPRSRRDCPCGALFRGRQHRACGGPGRPPGRH